MRPDMLGEWLPLALADILSAWQGTRREDALRSWELDSMADEIDNARTLAFLETIRR